MKVRILRYVEGAREARGLAVVIDVFRAFTTACFAVANGAERLVPVADLETAYALRRGNPSFLLMGERGGEKQPGFDFGNSPSEIEGVDFTGRTLIQTTSAGTLCLAEAARAATEVVTGAFVNAGAVTAYVRRARPDEVSLVACGTWGREENAEDLACAEYLRERIEGREPDFAPVREELRRAPSAARFLDPERLSAPARDLELCLSLDRFPFVLRCERATNGQLSLRRLNV